MIFVDTNYFVRLLREDIKIQYDEAKMLLLQGSEGKVNLFTSTVVFFEIYWVLGSFYKYKKFSVAESLEKILDLSCLWIEDKKILKMAVNLYNNSNLDLEDSYNLIYAKENKSDDFKTFDEILQKKFKSIK